MPKVASNVFKLLRIITYISHTYKLYCVKKTVFFNLFPGAGDKIIRAGQRVIIFARGMRHSLGVMPANVLIVGAGTVGSNAVKIAVGMDARVTVMNKVERQLVHLDEIYAGKVNTLMANEYNLANEIQLAGLVAGAVLILGAKAPKVITREMVGR